MVVLAMVVGGVMVLGCGDDEGPAPIRKLVSITVSHNPAGDIEEGAEVQFTATGTYDREPLKEDITEEVTWSVTGDGSIDANGLFTAGDPDCVDGAATVKAELGGIADNETVTITNAPLVLGSIAVSHTPAGVIAEGATAQFTATGSYDECVPQDITSIVTWGFTGDGASISAGLFTASDLLEGSGGSATVKATSGVISGEETVDISVVVHGTVPLLAIGVAEPRVGIVLVTPPAGDLGDELISVSIEAVTDAPYSISLPLTVSGFTLIAGPTAGYIYTPSYGVTPDVEFAEFYILLYNDQDLDGKFTDAGDGGYIARTESTIPGEEEVLIFIQGLPEAGGDKGEKNGYNIIDTTGGAVILVPIETDVSERSREIILEPA